MCCLQLTTAVAATVMLPLQKQQQYKATNDPAVGFMPTAKINFWCTRQWRCRQHLLVQVNVQRRQCSHHDVSGCCNILAVILVVLRLSAQCTWTDVVL